jgi:hypothetical protein
MALILEMLHPLIFAHGIGMDMQMICNSPLRPALCCKPTDLFIHVQLPDPLLAWGSRNTPGSLTRMHYGS